MASRELQATHPRRAGIGDALARMVPLDEPDKDERKLLHRIELGEKVRK